MPRTLAPANVVYCKTKSCTQTFDFGRKDNKKFTIHNSQLTINAPAGGEDIGPWRQ